MVAHFSAGLLLSAILVALELDDQIEDVTKAFGSNGSCAVNARCPEGETLTVIGGSG